MNEDEKLDAIIREYKMSMGGSFFNRNVKEAEKRNNKEINVDLESYLLDMDQIFALYDKLDEEGRRELFRKVIEAFIELKLGKK